APVALQVVNGIDQATVSIASLAQGEHTINASYSGDSSFAASSVAHPLVETVNAVTAPAVGTPAVGTPAVGTPTVDGPGVEVVQGWGIPSRPTVLLMTSTEALAPTSAVKLSNYRITDPAGRSVRIKSAVYDARTHSVTLLPAERINLHHTY